MRAQERQVVRRRGVKEANGTEGPGEDRFQGHEEIVCEGMGGWMENTPQESGLLAGNVTLGL